MRGRWASSHLFYFSLVTFFFIVAKKKKKLETCTQPLMNVPKQRSGDVKLNFLEISEV